MADFTEQVLSRLDQGIHGLPPTRSVTTPARPAHEPFSWQLPQRTSTYTALNEELATNEKQHFGEDVQFQRNGPDSSVAVPQVSQSTSSQPLQETHSVWRHPQRASYFLPNSNCEPLSEDSFLDWYPKGAATLTFQNDKDQLQSIPDLSLTIIGGRSAFLAMAFEDSRSGPRLFLETLTSATAYPFLRFLYSGSYALTGPTGDIFEEVPTSVLFHCQLYHLGDMYDLEELKTQAYVNVLRQCEFGCSSPEKPIDLCAAIQYLYQHLPNDKRVANTILDYCVSCFLRHRLGEDQEFRSLAYELRPFHQALCANTRERGFEDEGATAIIQLPFKPYRPDTYASRDEDVFVKRFDDVFHFHDEDEFQPKKRKRLQFDASTRCERTNLPFRIRVNDQYNNSDNPSLAEPNSASKKKRAAFFADASPVFGPFAASNGGLRVSEIKDPLPMKNADDRKGVFQEAFNEEPIAENADTEFEMLPKPSEVEDTSSDSDADLVKVRYADIDQEENAGTLGCRLEPDSPGRDSESDWELL